MDNGDKSQSKPRGAYGQKKLKVENGVEKLDNVQRVERLDDTVATEELVNIGLRHAIADQSGMVGTTLSLSLSLSLSLVACWNTVNSVIIM